MFVLQRPKWFPSVGIIHLYFGSALKMTKMLLYHEL